MKAGGKALPVVVDVRDEDSVAAAVEKAVATFGGIDVLGTSVRHGRLGSACSSGLLDAAVCDYLFIAPSC